MWLGVLCSCSTTVTSVSCLLSICDSCLLSCLHSHSPNFCLLRSQGFYYWFCPTLEICNVFLSQFIAFNNNNNNNTGSMLMVLSSQCNVASRVHPVHVMNADCARWPPTLRPSQPTWAVSPPLGSCHLHSPLPVLLLLSWKADTHFTIPWRVEGRVDLSTAGKVLQPMPQTANHNSCFDNHTDGSFSPAARYACTRPLLPTRPVGVSNLPKVTAGQR